MYVIPYQEPPIPQTHKMILTHFILALKLAIKIMIYSQLLLEFGSPETYSKTRRSSFNIAELLLQSWPESEPTCLCGAPGSPESPWLPSQQRVVISPAGPNPRGGVGAPASSSGALRGSAGKFTTPSRKKRLQGQAGKAGGEQSKPASCSSPLLRSD